MRTRRFVVSAAILFWPALVFGADVSGIWMGTLTDRNGDPQDFSFRFVQKGEKLSGKMYGDNESLPLTAASVSEKEIAFSVTTELNGQISTFLYKGTIEGNEILLSRSRVDAGSSRNNAGKPPGFGDKVRLKRLT